MKLSTKNIKNIPNKVQVQMENIPFNNSSQKKINTIFDSDNYYFNSKMKKLMETYKQLLSFDAWSTPYEIIKETRLYRLLHYKSSSEKRISPPILIVYALINRSYILDLQENKSWIKNLVDRGFDIYLIDWKEPCQIDKYTGFEDYVNIFMDDCINFILNNNSVEKISLHGYCMGATMSVMYSALYTQKIKNLVTLAPVIDTSKDNTVIGNFSRNIDIETTIESNGNMPSDLLYNFFSMLKPFKHGVNKYFMLYEKIDDDVFVENFLRIERWLFDIPHIAGELFKQWIQNIYQKNLLAKNQMKLNDEIIDISKINIPFLNIVADDDHLVSPEGSVELNSLVSSQDNELMNFSIGHIGLVASSYSQSQILPRIQEWFSARSDI